MLDMSIYNRVAIELFGISYLQPKSVSTKKNISTGIQTAWQLANEHACDKGWR